MSFFAQKKLIIYLLILLIFIGFSFFLSPSTFSAGTLDKAKDVISNENLSATDILHEISFQLPYDSLLISANDYITIELSNFSDITTPTEVTGYYSGSPSFSVDNQQKIIQITGINVVPGATVNINGVTASNPNMENYFGVSIIVSEDEDYQLIKNIASFEAVASDSQVTVSASIAPPVAALTISGYTGPYTFVTIMENGTVMGTNVSSSTGLFVKYLNGLDPGNHDVSLYGVDQDYRSTSIYNFSVTTPIYQETSVSNIILSPTIEISDTEIDLASSDTLTANGSTIPSGNVTIFTETPLSTYYATASATGVWTVDIDDIDEYQIGDYRIYSLVNDGGGSQSIFSNSLQFSVMSSTEASSGANPTCDISYGDLNCDAVVDLSDFSVLMFYWGTNTAAADINSDGNVNLTDFSIMMYYWG